MFDTSESADISFGPKFLRIFNLGGGGGSITVKQTRMILPNAGKRYRLEYAQMTFGGGKGWSALGLVSISFSTESSYSAPVDGQSIYRLDGAPKMSGEGGPPSGFAGWFATYNVSVGFVKQRTRTTLLMGSTVKPQFGRDIGTLPWKYCTEIESDSWSPSAGGGTSECYGYFSAPYDRDKIPPAPTGPVRPIPHF